MVTIHLHQMTTATPGGKHVPGKALATTVKAIEARNYQTTARNS